MTTDTFRVTQIKKQVQAHLPTRFGEFNIVAFSKDDQDPMPHLALVHRSIDVRHPVLVRIHSECLTGDLFGSSRCDCGEQLHRSLDLIQQQHGVLLYLRQEGRNIGLINKLHAYNLQDEGFNTADANAHLGLDIDGRDYEIAIQMMHRLGVSKIKLLTNNPLKMEAIKDSDIELVERIPLIIPPKEENAFYMQTKRDLMGHLLGMDQFPSQGE